MKRVGMLETQPTIQASTAAKNVPALESAVTDPSPSADTEAVNSSPRLANNGMMLKMKTLL